ncbi:hypothetical protein IJJ37_01860 [Candidatus Saccharibacteria bacterium]|nr:hypothetical protein [Candidatus Saccharibacteria bacterium]
MDGTESSKPILNPTPGFDADAAPVAAPTMTEPPMNPATMVTPATFGATDPITMPTPPKAPDPVEEELKAPFKAAEPVPGSIGSAISVPAEGAPKTSAPVDMSMFGAANAKKNTPSVAFNDPATTNQTQPSMPTKPMKPMKKTDKKTLIALAIVGGMVVIALAAVLIAQLIG